ncbi:uncharacterized protein LOC120219545 [Hibiscus syriacus]|uniref:uncharacterized protein LOC120219545 n=1 Tax=Hibiscus syriacus TaxID=106335 RepID=UPI001920C0A7|nr:uncharacterized protein LOC120219545 [Hibiscus syriacus]
MDGTEKQKQSLSQLITQFQRKPSLFLLSVPVVSLFLSHPYWFPFLYSFNSTLHDTLAFKLFSHSIDKNIVFLLCNGLLVFLVKYPGVTSSSKHDLSECVPRTHPTRLQPETPLLEKEGALENSSVKEGKQEEEEENAGFLEEDKEDQLNWSIEEEEEKEELMEGNKALSTEELNKKFDEFIRKMKEELRIEARQQLVMV